MTQSQHIVIVDDEAPAREMVGEYLKMHGFTVTLCDGGKTLRGAIEANVPDLVVLDLNMPEEDGLSIIRDLKSRINVPVIMLTATASPIDRVVGLELGADDYIAKPFSLRELLARVRAVLRRHEMGRAARAHDPERGGYRFDGWRLERRSRSLFDPEGNPVSLTKGEYGLLLAFLEAPQRPLTREHLLQATRVHEDIFDRSIDVQVLRLRRKLETDPSAPRVIQTERGVGYIFALAVEPF